jgi:hypothetical protein
MAANNEGLSPITIGIIVVSLVVLAGIFYFGAKTTNEFAATGDDTGLSEKNLIDERTDESYEEGTIEVIGEPEYIEEETDLPPKNAPHLQQKGEKAPPAIL